MRIKFSEGACAMLNQFEKNISPQTGDTGLLSEAVETLQVNLGLKCNQQCLHCHLECSPSRMEMMEWPVMECILQAVDASNCRLVDLTGGAPELNTHFRRFVVSLQGKKAVM